MTKILLYKGDKNDATTYYLEIIENALKQIGESVVYVNSAKEIKKDETVVCIIPKSFWSVFSRRLNSRIIYWFQGVVPEEIAFYNYSSFKKIINRTVYSMMERLILRKSTFNLFVSNTMVQHYQSKYKYNKTNYFVMPCFNQQILKDAFNSKKYETPTFVYTGNLAKWQCFEEMVTLFRDIKNSIPAATLTVYTKDSQEAKAILSRYGVSAQIKYVPYNILNEELKQYKYGFILRKDNVVNNVATPTKMNSYLASGIIPLYTDVVGAYKENLSNLKYAIPITVENKGLEKLYQLEKEIISGNDVFMDFSPVFDCYYNIEFYVEAIANEIKEFF